MKYQAIQQFANAHSDLGVLDLPSFLPAEAFYDGCHVYDEINDNIAKELTQLIEKHVNLLCSKSDSM